MTRVIAFMPVYNEADILAASLRRVLASGVTPYVLDNWSTDGSWEIAHACTSAADIAGVERIPRDGPLPTYSLELMRARIAELAQTLPADWFVWNDADEYIHPPSDTQTLCDALHELDMDGFTAVELVAALFPPVDDGFHAGADFTTYFRWWRPQPPPPGRPWIRIWSSTGVPVRFYGGNHEVDFDGRRVAPVPFILRHYPLRSQAHAVHKIFVDRRPRFAAAERRRGWHTHYDDMESTKSFLEDPCDLHALDEATFAHDLFRAVGRMVEPR